MGIGGILGGLANISPAIQNGNLQGQIQGKEMNINTQMALAKLAQEQMIAQSEAAKNYGSADWLTGRGQNALDVQGIKSGTALTMADLTNALKQQHEQDYLKLGEGRNDIAATLAEFQKERTQAGIERMNALLGNTYVNQFLGTTKNLRDTMKGYDQADAALTQAKDQNPAAVRATLLSLATNDTGGSGARKAVIDYAARVHPDIVGNLAQNIGLLGSGAFSDKDISNIAGLISQQHQTAKSLYTQQFIAAVKAHPGAESAFAPYAPDTQFDIPGNPSGMGTNAQPSPAPTQVAPGAWKGGYSSWNTLAPKQPGMPNAVGAAGTPNGNAPSGP